MRAGKLRYRVKLQSKDAGRDAWGQPSGSFGDVATVWADILYPNGKEQTSSGRETSVVEASVVIRKRSDVTAGWRVVHGTDVFEIKAVLPGKERDRTYLVCTLGASQG